ncbi:hypothetical protein ACFL6Y_11585 [Elusimicrobiota bacterium]
MTINAKLKKIFKFIFISSFIIHHSSFISPLYAGGLRVMTGDVYLSNLQIGNTYSLTELTGVPFQVQSNFTEPMEILIGPEKPGMREGLRAGYERIPASSWLTIEPSKFELAPGQQGLADVMITIPDDAELRGRKFQGHLWTRSNPDPSLGMGVVVGVKTRILFDVSIDTFTKKQKQEMRQLKKALNYMFMPGEINVKKGKVGKWRLKKRAKKMFKIINPNDEELRFTVNILNESEARLKNYSISSMVYGDPSWASIAEDKKDKDGYVAVEGNSIFLIPIKFDLPKTIKKEKGVYFILQATLQGYSVPVTSYGKIVINLK